MARDLTFLFTDIEGSTRAWERDLEAMDVALRRHDEILRRAIDDHRGHIFSTAGDGVAAMFTTADGAVAAAVAAQAALLAETWSTAAPLRVRMGLHTGGAIERDGDYFGPAVIRAARLMSLVDGGRIICSAATGAALSDPLADVKLLPIGTVELKGLSRPEAALAISAPGLVESGDPVGGPRPSWPRPTFASSLVGRDELIAEVADHLAPGALVTLVGIGGIGKTRLAVAVADRVAPSRHEQVAWLDLTATSDLAAIVFELAALFGVRAARDEDLVDKIATAIGERDILVVLDNCEHVADATSSLIGSLMRRCARLAVLATSREHLALVDQRLVAVGPLDDHGTESWSVELLLDRLGARRADLSTAELSTLADIAGWVDGVPLALELVAARCRRLGIVEVGHRLRGHLGDLVDATRMPRHRTLDDAIDWSYVMLTPSEQAVLRALAVFRAWFDLDAIEAVVGGDPAETDAVVASLLDKSLVERDGHRFRLLAMTRHYAGQRLAEADDREATEAAHAEHVKSRVLAAHEGLHGRDEARWVDELDVLWPDVRAAVRRALDAADADLAIELTTHLAFEAFFRRPEAFTWIEETVGRWGDRPGPHRHELLGAGGFAAWTQFDVAEGVRLATLALDADPDPGTALDCLPECAALGAFGFAGRFDEAVATARRALPRLSGGADRWNRAIMHGNIANVLGISGKGAGNDDFERAVELSRNEAFSIANPTAIAYAYLVDAFGSGPSEPERARVAVECARAYAGEVDNRWVRTMAASTIALGSGALADEDAVTVTLEIAQDLHRSGWPTHAWCALWGVIDALFGLGHPEVAAMVLGGCEASGVTRLAMQRVPTDLSADLATTAAFRRLGSSLRFDDLVAYAAGQRPPPAMPARVH